MIEREATKIELGKLIDRYNSNHALKVKSLDENALGCFIINWGTWQTSPMTINEAFYWMKGFKDARELVA